MAEISDQGIIELSAGPLRLGLVPGIGGSVAYFRRDGTDLMRAMSPADIEARNVLGAAMFPMVPYANRIADNSFEFEGKTWRFEPNNPPERFNVHGSGWTSAWHGRQDRRGVVLSLDHIAGDEPYSYSATQLFSLGRDRLSVEMTLTNRGKVRMPFGFGLHPWFDRERDTGLSFKARHFFLEGPEGIATDRIRTPPELDFTDGGPLPATWRNNDYGGWDGRAELRFPSRGLGLRIDADPIFSHLMLYADPKRSVFCVEPQSNAPCAFNRLITPDADGFGARVLEPGESLEGTVSFSPFSL
jgi:aldose 1-epimerase